AYPPPTSELIGRLQHEQQAFENDLQTRRRQMEELASQLEESRLQLEAQTQKLQDDQAIWFRRREELELECRQLQETRGKAETAVPSAQLTRDLAAARADL